MFVVNNHKGMFIVDEKIWKVTETLIKVINEETHIERKQRLIEVVNELKSIHQGYMDDLMEVGE